MNKISTLYNALCISFSTFTRIPIKVQWSEKSNRLSMFFFPLVGAVLGGIMYACFMLFDAFHLSPFLKGALCTAVPLLYTGGIHMDGFMDTVDAISAWQTKERRLEILKDTHIGAFAGIYVCVYLLVMCAILSEVNCTNALAVSLVFVLSRTMSMTSSILLPNAREKSDNKGMLHAVTQDAPKRKAVLYGAILTLVLFVLYFVLLGAKGIYPVLSALLVLFYYVRFTSKYFGGVTGDLAGYLVQITELFVILSIVIGGKIL